jgi:hypothetical protein
MLKERRLLELELELEFVDGCAKYDAKFMTTFFKTIRNVVEIGDKNISSTIPLTGINITKNEMDDIVNLCKRKLRRSTPMRLSNRHNEIMEYLDCQIDFKQPYDLLCQYFVENDRYEMLKICS